MMCSMGDAISYHTKANLIIKEKGSQIAVPALRGSTKYHSGILATRG